MTATANLPRRGLWQALPAEGEGGVFTQSWFPLCLAAEVAPGGAAAEPLELLLGGTALLTPDALAELVFA